jgi:hypothetical protein
MSRSHDDLNTGHLESLGGVLDRDDRSTVGEAVRLAGDVRLTRCTVTGGTVARSILERCRVTGNAIVIDAVLEDCDVSGTAIVIGRWRNLRASSGLWIAPDRYTRDRRGFGHDPIDADAGVTAGDGRRREDVRIAPDHSIDGAIAAMRRASAAEAARRERETIITSEKAPNGLWRRVGGVSPFDPDMK